MEHIYITCDSRNKNCQLDFDIWQEFLPAEAMLIHDIFTSRNTIFAIYRALDFNCDFKNAPFKPQKIDHLSVILAPKVEGMHCGFLGQNLPVESALTRYDSLTTKSAGELLEEIVIKSPGIKKTIDQIAAHTASIQGSKILSFHVGLGLYAALKELKFKLISRHIIDYNIILEKLNQEGQLSLAPINLEGALSETADSELSLIE